MLNKKQKQPKEKKLAANQHHTYNTKIPPCQVANKINGLQRSIFSFLTLTNPLIFLRF